jgi:hypothetical protein
MYCQAVRWIKLVAWYQGRVDQAQRIRLPICHPEPFAALEGKLRKGSAFSVDGKADPSRSLRMTLLMVDPLRLIHPTKLRLVA